MYHLPDQHDKIAVVTGSNSGTGKEAARRLAGAGATVILAVRTLAKGDDARLEILRQYPEARLEVRHLDVADLSSVRAFAETLLAEKRPLDLLVNNAGVMAPPERLVSVDGFELQFATNFLGPFALTLRLLPLLRAANQGRVATMSSSAAAFGTIRYRDLQRERHYVPYLAYAQSKLADLLFAQHLARLANQRRWNLMSNAAHPGFTRTNLLTAGASLGRGRQRPAWLTNAMFLASQGVEPGTEPLLYAATSPEALSGAYYGPGRLFGLVGPTTLVRVPRSARHDDDGARLWHVAEELTGVALADA
ncbi:MAG TPA: SDR family oxidoreductase [Acidimicrobiales bacterium]|nr:SDR family oxidoreductase [Acidimicrobiales bacterium]